ncbi:MAG: hypothetical protein JXI43_05715 [Tissierellales bacterium]|nr:hypothetical protein [Tissierellales bacterium]
MTSIPRLKQETNRLVEDAWVTLGMPFDRPMIDEKAEGIIDVEALIISTLLVIGNNRLVTDLPAWINQFLNLINFQKLKTIFNGLPEEHRKLILANLNQIHFSSTPRAFRNVFNLRTRESESADETVRLRTSKINTIENVAQISLIIKNRLLYGTSFRADLITLMHIERISMKGTELAKLLCANNSTISRILSDLKACNFLNDDKERIDPFEPYPGMFLSVLSVWNLYEMIDATQFSFEELKKGILENMNFKHDAFGKRLSNKLY